MLKIQPEYIFYAVPRHRDTQHPSRSVFRYGWVSNSTADQDDRNRNSCNPRLGSHLQVHHYPLRRSEKCSRCQTQSIGTNLRKSFHLCSTRSPNETAASGIAVSLS